MTSAGRAGLDPAKGSQGGESSLDWFIHLTQDELAKPAGFLTFDSRENSNAGGLSLTMPFKNKLSLQRFQLDSP